MVLVLGWVGPYVEGISSPLSGEGDCDETVGKFGLGVGNLLKLYVKGDILSSEEIMAKWHLFNHLIAIEDWMQTSNAGRDRREES